MNRGGGGGGGGEGALNHLPLLFCKSVYKVCIHLYFLHSVMSENDKNVTLIVSDQCFT